MLKYVDAVIGMAEIPDEISLCISISGCQLRCSDCHSKYLWEDIGEYLTFEKLEELIRANEGITCVCIMGGLTEEVRPYFEFIKENFPYKTAWYTGANYVLAARSLLDFVDYLKIGGYLDKYGGLDNPNTNQRMYKIENITHRFWKNEN